MLGRKICPGIINKRKQCHLLKAFIPFVIFLFAITYFLGIPELSSYWSHESKYLNENEQQGINDLRKSVLSENTDEFLEIVLKDLAFKEIDLYNQRKFDANSKYDKEIAEDAKKVIPRLGEGGEKATVPPDKQELASKIQKKNAFNRLLSEMISYTRRVPDTRERACRKLTYNTSELPSMSVIIIFTNEAYISIVRMLHSLFDRTPSNLLKEIILVDDFSDLMDLQGKLERYLATTFPVHKIRLLRLAKRSGLIRARMIGAHVAVGDVLVFLDAHCEVIKFWSEPLLQRIQKKRTAVVVPVIDVIDADTMEYSKGQDGYFFIGGFKWSGHFYWIPIPEYEEATKKFHYYPTRTPTMAGGLFAIDRKYFWEMGSYDPDMETWGGENLEMSFRIWQCGGSVETIPCSRVGHIFRPYRPYTFNGNTDRKNILRTAAVWMGDYKKLVFKSGQQIDYGDVSRRIEFKKRKNCEDFQWYLDYIYKQKFKLQMDSRKWGQVKNLASDYCLDNMGKAEDKPYRLEVYPCHNKLFSSQTHYWSNKNELRRELLCAVPQGPKVEMVTCDHAKEDKYKWDYDSHYGTLTNRATGKCLATKFRGVAEGQYEVVQEECNRNLNQQKWIFDTLEDDY